MNIIISNPQKAECFTGIFQHMKSFTDNINLSINDERLYIQTMDNCRISVFELNLPRDWFDKFEHTGKTDTIIGVNSSIFFRVLNARDKNQQINIVYDNENNVDKLEIHFTPIIATSSLSPVPATEFDKHFEISLLDIDTETFDIPKTEYQAEFSLASNYFANMVNQLKMFSDNLDLVCCEEKIMLCSNSLEQGKMFVEIKIDDLTTFSIDEGETIKISFSLTQLHNICLYNKMSKEVELKFKRDFPMKVIYNLAGHPDAHIIFYLAPKINEDDV